MIKRMLHILAICVCLGLNITLAQESTSLPEKPSNSQALSGPEGSTTQEATTALPPAPKVSALTPMMRNVINVMFWGLTLEEFNKPQSAVHEEIEKMYPGAIIAEIQPLDSAFDTNEVKANRKFKGKWIWILGRVGKISDSEEKGPSMIVHEVEKSPTIKAFFANHDKARDVLEVLEPGQLTSLMCHVSGIDKSQLQMKDCDFFDPLTLTAFQSYREKFFEALEGTGNLSQNAPIAFMLLAAEDSMSEDFKNSCAKSEIDCIIAFMKHPKKHEPDIDKVMKQFEALGYTKQMIEDNPNSLKTVEEIVKLFS